MSSKNTSKPTSVLRKALWGCKTYTKNDYVPTIFSGSGTHFRLFSCVCLVSGGQFGVKKERWGITGLQKYSMNTLVGRAIFSVQKHIGICLKMRCQEVNRRNDNIVCYSGNIFITLTHNTSTTILHSLS